MLDTTMYTKGASDGWVLVASAADNVSIKSNSEGFWYVAVAATKPVADFEGEKLEGSISKLIMGLSGSVYVRVVTAHSYAVTVGALQLGVAYGLDASGALVAQGMIEGAAKTAVQHPLSSVVQYKEVFADVVGAKKVLTFTDSQVWTEATILVTSNVAALPDDIIGMVIINGDDIIEDAVFNGGVVRDSNGAIDVHYIVPNEPTVIPVLNEVIKRVAIISGRGGSTVQGLNFNITMGKYDEQYTG